MVGRQTTHPVWRTTTVLQLIDDVSDGDVDPDRWVSKPPNVIVSEPVLYETLNQLDQSGGRIFENSAALADHLS